MSVSQSGKRMLLLGAGFSKNWGGRLAKEVWADVFTNSTVQARERVRQALLNERSFEGVMDDVLTGEDYDSEDLQAIIESVTKTFRRMDTLFMTKSINATRSRLNYGTLTSFLSKFSESVLFTLNQDTLLERLLQYSLIAFDTPYVQRFDDAKIPDEQPASSSQATSGNISIVKLHGSHTWSNSEGVPVMVLGISKSQRIAGSWLLTEYKKTFEEALYSGGVRLLVMGYSFGDKHVNEIIATAASHHQCRIFVWNPNHPLDMLQEPKQREILGGLMGWEPRLIDEVMPAIGQIQTPDDPNEIFPEFFN
ncbi:MAG: SIR2 family protein [Methylocella sp.]